MEKHHINISTSKHQGKSTFVLKMQFLIVLATLIASAFAVLPQFGSSWGHGGLNYGHGGVSGIKVIVGSSGHGGGSGSYGHGGYSSYGHGGGYRLIAVNNGGSHGGSKFFWVYLNTF